MFADIAMGTPPATLTDAHQDAPWVSVLVPTYQHAAFIGACLDGILMQRCEFPVEILVGEDESSDGTRAICEQYAFRHPGRIRLFLRSRKDVLYINGQATGRANLMALLSEARGKYLVICEGDDHWTDPLKLQAQVDLLEYDSKCAGTYHNSSVIDESGRQIEPLWRIDMKDRITLEDVVAPRAVFHTSSFVFRNYPVFKALPRFFRSVSVGDLAIFALVAGQGPLRKVEGVMSAYRKHGAGITASGHHNGARFHVERMRLWMHLDRHFPGRIARQATEICDLHWSEVLRFTSGRERLRALGDLFLDIPVWFILRPGLTFSMLRSIWPR